MANASEGGSSVVESYAGLDWAKEEHRLCVLHADGRLLSEQRVIHDERDIASMCTLLVELGVRRIAIERPDGLLVERLLEADLVVLVIHPNQLKAARPRALGALVASPILSTPSAWQNSLAPTTIASGH
jgi:hypothetical protein